MSRKLWFSASLLILVLIPAVALVAVSETTSGSKLRLGTPYGGAETTPQVSETTSGNKHPVTTPELSKEPNDGTSKETKASEQTMEAKESNIVEPKRVRLETSMGDIVIELDEKKAPITVKNFLRYVEESFYDGTVFHRVISNFMIQGGGFTADMAQKETHPPIVNEAKNGLKNDRGTIAMARTNNPDSATSQFFINHKNNDSLNYAGPAKPGYAVFGKVVGGMEVVDKIAAVETTILGGMRDVPVKPVLIKSARVIPGKKD